MLTIYLIIGFMIGVLSGWYVANAKLSAYSQALQAKLEGAQKQLEETKEEFFLANHRNLQLGQDLARLETVNQHLTEKLGEQKQEVEAIQEKLAVQFRNLANDLLEEKSKKFTDQNKVNLEGLLKPLGERIQEFEKQVVQTNKESLERNVALRTEVKKLSELNAQITKEAENLTKAIKG
ncbi:MAG TPA: DNA recombination protein RmuC, partial [Amoebophilaceae bacterium]|nr:DNA recombination protein RmuC [Amoebophilaceae bacterium]